MKKIILVHGWSGAPNKDWLPWLKSKLGEKGYEVLAPEMPDTDTPVMEKWVKHLTQVIGENGPDEDTYFVGHSIGCQAILRYLNSLVLESSKMVGGAVFVAGWFDLENLESGEINIAKPWMESPINLAKIKTVLPKTTLIISKNDPYGALKLNEKKFREIGSKVIELPDAGHITAEDGFTELPQALTELEKLMNN